MIVEAGMKVGRRAQAPPKPSSGWGTPPRKNNSSGRSRNRGGGERHKFGFCQRWQRKGHYFGGDGSDDDIPTIPDLEDEEEEMIP